MSIARQEHNQTAAKVSSKAHASADAATAKPPGKLEQLDALLVRPGGAPLAEMMAATGWQQHSVHGAMAGALKKRGLTITSEKIDGVRRYRASRT